MQRRNATSAFSRRQPTSGRPQQRKSKVHSLGQDKVKVTSKQPVANQGVSPVQRPSVVMPKVKPPSTSTVGKIPPFNPNTVKVGKIPPFNPNTVKSNTTVKVRKQAIQKKSSPSRKRRLKPIARTILSALRLLIVGVGVGAIVGTVLSVFDPASRITTAGVQSNTTGQEQTQSTQNPSVAVPGISLSQENSSLKAAVQNLAASNTQLLPGIFLVDLESGTYVDVNGSSTFPAASTIKIPIAIAFFQDVDAGKIRLDETLTIQKSLLAGGSGDLQYKPVGTQFTALDVATKMITLSDNTAANMLITRLGGMETLNQRFRSWGLTNTVIRNPLPDLQGTNSTSPKELASLMAMVSKGNLVSMPSRDHLLHIMRNTVRNQLLPTGLGIGATIAHKTGDISTMLADAGLVDLPSGKRYTVAVMVQRPNNDIRAEKLIRAISQVTYQQFSQSVATPYGMGNTVPLTGYQSPMINSPLPNSAVPPNTYQPPVINPSLPNGAIPPVGYQSPMMNPTLAYPNGTAIPPTGYQSPVMTPPQYYYPYQR